MNLFKFSLNYLRSLREDFQTHIYKFSLNLNIFYKIFVFFVFLLSIFLIIKINIWNYFNTQFCVFKSNR